jgi:hypothetical protein
MSKYSQSKTMLLAQEYIILFLLNQFTIALIKTAFTLLIGGNGLEAEFFLFRYQHRNLN